MEGCRPVSARRTRLLINQENRLGLFSVKAGQYAERVHGSCYPITLSGSRKGIELVVWRCCNPD